MMRYLSTFFILLWMCKLGFSQESYSFKYMLEGESEYFYLVTITAEKKDMLVSALNLYSNSKIILLQNGDDVHIQLKHKTKDLSGYNFMSTAQVLISKSVMKTEDILQELEVSDCKSSLKIDNRKFNLQPNNYLLIKFRGRVVNTKERKADITLIEPENLLMFQLIQ